MARPGDGGLAGRPATGAHAKGLGSQPGGPGSAVDADNRACQTVRLEDLDCPVCLETLTDPFVTACGHSFCYSCISRHMEAAKNCPSCSHYLTPDLIYPNFLLSKIVKRARTRALDRSAPAVQLLQQALADHAAALGEGDVDALLRQLWSLKHGLQERQREASMELLLHFLHNSRQEKLHRLAQLQKELVCLDGDIQRVEAAGTVATGAGPAAPAGSHHVRPSTPSGRPVAAGAEGAAAAVPATWQAPVVPRPVEQQSGREQAGDSGTAHAAGQQQGVAAAAGVQAAAGSAPAGGQPLPAVQQRQQQQPPAWASGPVSAFGAAGGAQAPAAVQQHVADFASAVFASFAAQSLSPGALAANGGGASLPAQPMLLGHLPGMQHPHPGVHGSQLGAPGTAGALMGGLMSPAPTATTSSGAATSSGNGRSRDVLSLLRNKKRRIATQFDDLQQCYLQLRTGQLQGAASGEAWDTAHGTAQAVQPAGQPVGAVIDEGLQEFGRLLSVITRCNKLRLVAEVPRPTPRSHGSSSIISSLEFDREGALFATAGVSKRISIYQFAGVAPHHSVVAAPPLPGGAAVVRSGATPVVELLSRSKLSCLSWNKYIQAHIASSDYEGVVSVWDASTAALLHEYEAHSKRIWSVDFCGADPALLASGSDDCAVKFWSTNCPSSVAQVDTAANVCTVRWRPGSSTELAVGSADHSVYLYDLRNTSAPVCTFQGHRKAVSYVRYCNAGELVSASTDSTLRLWPVPGGGAAGAAAAAPAHLSQASRVYEGHANEKNFVGLAVDGDFLACGSETSELFVYYKSLSKPVAQQAFSLHGEDGADAQSDKGFISAVCWRPGAQTLLAANSQGTVKVFSLTGSSGHA